jgi:hypothetical protein
MALDNLGSHSDGALIVQSQAQKEVTANALLNLLSNATQKPLPITITGNKTLTDDEFFGNVFFVLTGSPSGAFDLNLPATGNHLFCLINNTGQTVTVKIGGGLNVSVFDTGTKIMHADGTDVIGIAPTAGAGGTTPYDLAVFIPTIEDFALAAQLVLPRAVSIPSGATGSQAYAETAQGSGLEDVVLDLRKNGTTFGDVTFASFSNTGVFTVASTTNFSAGDRLSVVPLFGSPTPEVELAGVSITFKIDI